MSTDVTVRLDRIAARHAAKSAVSELSFAVEQPGSGLVWSCGPADRPYFIASITKLFTVAVTMQLRSEGAFALDTPVAEILGEQTMQGLVVHDGLDYAAKITVRQLLAHTSGIADHYEDRDADNVCLADRLADEDRFWSFEELLQLTRRLPSPFVPGQPGRAHYSDTNFQLLGRVAEICDGERFDTVVRRRIIEQLGLQHTWHLTLDTQDRYEAVAPVFRKRRRLKIPLTLASSLPDGGVVSTTTDQLRFVRAFTSGELFPSAYLDEMTAQWNRLSSSFGPLRYGLGLMRFALPRSQTLFMRLPTMIGHSGSFGSVLYYAPTSDLYIAGTVNQTHPRSLPYPLVARILMALR